MDYSTDTRCGSDCFELGNSFGKFTFVEEIQNGEKGLKSLTVSVASMDCASCVPVIKKSVAGIRGVRDVRTALMLNKVIVDYDPKEVDVVKIRMAVEKAGFKAMYVRER